MNWTFHPKNSELTTSLPLSVEITDWVGKPTLTIEGIGEVPLKVSHQGQLKGDFYMTLPGPYKIVIKDSVEVKSFTINVSQHEYLNFNREFGAFFVLFLLVMGGIILWTRKIMQKKMPRI